MRRTGRSRPAAQLEAHWREGSKPFVTYRTVAQDSPAKPSPDDLIAAVDEVLISRSPRGVTPDILSPDPRQPVGIAPGVATQD